jgi:hypothetical protein
MGLYGNLTGQETAMYQSELPLRMEMAKYNSLAPVLSGLLGQFGGGGGMSISPISMGFDRPDVMRGYNDAVTNAQSAVRGAYGQAASAARSYDDEFRQAFTDNLDRLPSLPGTRAKQPAALPTGNAGYQFPPPVQAPGAKPPLARGPMAAPAGGMPAGKAPPVSPPRYHF